MRSELASILMCPSCGRGRLEILDVREESIEVREATLRCPGCGRRREIRKGMVDFMDEPSADVLREKEAWDSYHMDTEVSGEERQAARGWILGLPMLEGQPGPDAELETWRRHGRAIFELCDRWDWDGLRVLELGAGRCWLSAELAARGARVVAADILEGEFIGLGAGDFFIDTGRVFDRVLCDMHALPFAECSFDAVVATATLHHSHDPAALFAEVRRVLKRDGFMIAANEPLHVPWRKAPEEEARGAHEEAYSLARWRSFLRESGLELKHVEVGQEGALHLEALPSGRGSGLPCKEWINAHWRYAGILALALPRALLEAARAWKAGRPMRPWPPGRLFYLRARAGLAEVGARAVAGMADNWGPGWYEQEGDDEPFRWSAPRAIVLLPPPEGPAAVVLELATFHPSPHTEPVTVEVDLSGRRSGEVRLSGRGWGLYRFPLTAFPAKRPLAIKLRVKTGYFRPSEKGLGGDERILGVACRGAWLEAL